MTQPCNKNDLCIQYWIKKTQLQWFDHSDENSSGESKQHYDEVFIKAMKNYSNNTISLILYL